MEHWDGPAARDATPLIASLRQGVLAWMDADWVLPADGSSLLAALERTLAGLTAENALAARAGIEAFIAQVQALIDAGVLEAADGHPRIEAAVAIGALLCGADGTQMGRPSIQRPANADRRSASPSGMPWSGCAAPSNSSET
jgi:hypothetical protein